MHVHAADEGLARHLAVLRLDLAVARSRREVLACLPQHGRSHRDRADPGRGRCLADGTASCPHPGEQFVAVDARFGGGLDLLQEQLLRHLFLGLVGGHGGLRDGGQVAGFGVDEHQLLLDAHLAHRHVSHVPCAAPDIRPGTDPGAVDTRRVAGCCDPQGYEDMFGESFARRMAKRYRRRGVDPTATQMVDFLAQDDLTGATILEIGGGIGEISVELLRRGAESATIAELSTAYDEEARRLAEKAGVADRVRRHIINVAEAPEAMEQADLVVLHRVVCCYPDYTQLLGAASGRARRRLAFSHPPRNIVSRALAAIENSTFVLMRKEFRTFVHPPQAMLDVVGGGWPEPGVRASRAGGGTSRASPAEPRFVEEALR